MTPPRKKSATTRHTPKAKPKAKPKGKPVKRSAPTRRAAASLDVFIPKESQPVPVASFTARGAEIEIFVPRLGPPIEVQSDFIDDGAPGWDREETDAFFNAVGAHPGEPRTMSPAGWTPALLREHGLEVVRGVVQCRYGCGRGTTSNLVGVSSHGYACQYWHSPEGRAKTPF